MKKFLLAGMTGILMRGQSFIVFGASAATEMEETRWINGLGIVFTIFILGIVLLVVKGIVVARKKHIIDEE